VHRHPSAVETVDGARTGGENENVEGLGGDLSGGQITHGDLTAVAIDANDLMAGAHVEIEPRAQRLRSLQQKVVTSFDDPADEVRQAAIRERHVVALLEHDDLGRLIQPTEPRRSGHAARDTSDDDDFARLPKF
jgi:hypothetical protein